MKNYLTSVAASIIIFSFGCKKKSDEITEIKTGAEKASYGIGINIGENFKKDGLDSLNSEIIAQGINDALKGEDYKIPKDTALMAIQTYVEGMRMKSADKNLEEGKKFLEENKKKEGVVTLPSGLQYKIITPGTGPKPGLEDVVTTHYHGTTIDGKVFDSSVERGEPATFPVNGVIPGWTEALQLMPEGSKWRLFIPSELAYGERGAGKDIGPNSTLIFEVELLKIEPKKPEPSK